MKLEKEDYMDPTCVLCGKPGEPEEIQPIPVGRVLDKLRDTDLNTLTPLEAMNLLFTLKKLLTEGM